MNLADHGVRNVLIACSDGLTGLPDPIRSSYPDAIVRTHMVAPRDLPPTPSGSCPTRTAEKDLATSMRAMYSAPTRPSHQLLALRGLRHPVQGPVHRRR